MTQETSVTAPTGLPQRPPSSHAEAEEEDRSPPRKRPRTRAPPQAAASASTTKSEIPSPQNAPPKTNSEVHRFSIQPVNRFRGASATIKRPRQVAHFSYDDNHEYQADESGISYYVPPPMGADLKEGFETFKHYEDKEDPHLDSLLRALVEEQPAKSEIKVDFMTWRGMMTKVS